MGLLVIPLLLASCSNNPTSSSSSQESSEELTTSESSSESFDAKKYLLEKLNGDLALSFSLKKFQIDKTSEQESGVELTDAYTFVGEDEYWNEEIDANGTIIETVHIFKNSDGEAVRKQVSLDNTNIEDEVQLNYETWENQIYDEKYSNPFKNLDVALLEEIDTNTFKLDLEQLNQNEYIHTLFTQYDGGAEELIFTISNGDNVSITFEYSASYDMGDYVDYLVGYEMNGSLLTKEEINVPTVSLLEEKDETQEVRNLIEKLKNQDYEFTYTITDPDTNEVSEQYDVVVNKNMYIISHTEDGVTNEYGAIDTDDGLVDFNVDNTTTPTTFNATGAPLSDLCVEDRLVEFLMAPEFFYLVDGVYKLEPRYNLTQYLSYFLPSTLIEDDSIGVDEETFEMTIDNDNVQISYDYSYALWHKDINITKLENATMPYDNYTIVYPEAPTSWADVDFYQDLVDLLGSEERVSELPFIYPDLGWTNTIIIADFGMGTLMGSYSSAEAASNAQFDYMMELIMSGYMMGTDDMDTYEKTYDDCTVQVSTSVNDADFNLYIDVI